MYVGAILPVVNTEPGEIRRIGLNPLKKSGWIFRHISQREEAPLLLPETDRRVCVCLLSEAVERVYPLVAAAKKERIEAVRPGVGVMEKHAGPACVPAPLLLYEFIEKR